MLLAFSNPPTAAFAMSLIIENILILPITFVILEVCSSRGQGLKPTYMFLYCRKKIDQKSVDFGCLWRRISVDLSPRVTSGH